MHWSWAKQRENNPRGVSEMRLTELGNRRGWRVEERIVKGDWGFPGGSVGKESMCNAGDTRDVGWIPRLGRSRGVGNGNPCWYSCLENFMDRGAWRATVHGATKSQTRLSGWTHTHQEDPHTLPFSSILLKKCYSSSEVCLEQETGSFHDLGGEMVRLHQPDI